MEKGLNELWEFNYIYESFNVFRASNPFIACILTNKISDFPDDRISCTCLELFSFAEVSKQDAQRYSKLEL